jgi:DNA-binding response OmpR family regulator
MAIQWPYDLVLLDVMVPKLNGIEVCRRLRGRECQTPIMFLTGKGANEDVVAGLDAGADDYVVKSCEPAQMIARVRALLRRSGAVISSPVLHWDSRRPHWGISGHSRRKVFEVQHLLLQSAGVHRRRIASDALPGSHSP